MTERELQTTAVARRPSARDLWTENGHWFLAYLVALSLVVPAILSNVKH